MYVLIYITSIRSSRIRNGSFILWLGIFLKETEHVYIFVFSSGNVVRNISYAISVRIHATIIIPIVSLLCFRIVPSILTRIVSIDVIVLEGILVDGIKIGGNNPDPIHSISFYRVVKDGVVTG